MWYDLNKDFGGSFSFIVQSSLQSSVVWSGFTATQEKGVSQGAGGGRFVLKLGGRLATEIGESWDVEYCMA